MILSFKKQFPEKIMKGYKIHSIREDPYNRWKAGRKIHMATGVRTKNYNCFKENICKSIQEFQIVYVTRVKTTFTIYIDGKRLLPHEVYNLAINDGFDTVFEFLKWFNEDFKGKIIHWTDLKY